jgi:hypothetical protein
LTETITEGKVVRLNEWAKGKGYFVNLEGSELDFYDFRKASISIGEFVRITSQPGTKNFAEKQEVMRIEKPMQQVSSKGPAAAPAQKPVSSQEPNWDKIRGEKRDSIERQCALKAAVELVKGSMPIGETIDVLGFAAQALEVSKKFEAYLNGKP